MIDLKITKAEAKRESNLLEVNGLGDRERYSYGTRITLADAELKKLGIIDLPDVGTEITFEATAKVINARQSASESSKSRGIELQITHMEIEDASKEKEEDANEKAKSVIAKKLDSM